MSYLDSVSIATHFIECLHPCIEISMLTSRYTSTVVPPSSSVDTACLVFLLCRREILAALQKEKVTTLWVAPASISTRATVWPTLASVLRSSPRIPDFSGSVSGSSVASSMCGSLSWSQSPRRTSQALLKSSSSRFAALAARRARSPGALFTTFAPRSVWLASRSTWVVVGVPSMLSGGVSFWVLFPNHSVVPMRCRLIVGVSSPTRSVFPPLVVCSLFLTFIDSFLMLQFVLIVARQEGSPTCQRLLVGQLLAKWPGLWHLKHRRWSRSSFFSAVIGPPRPRLGANVRRGAVAGRCSVPCKPSPWRAKSSSAWRSSALSVARSISVSCTSVRREWETEVDGRGSRAAANRMA